ncbi:MAG: DUF2971 domain-containing protein [Prosthecobacter sp.]|uniref:DUF2971 domain-containing protein n=1 Tax=Prosthecobacter sp. TaxID=1965333 RepID=UPI003BB020D0
MLTYKYSPSSRTSFFEDRNLRFSQPTALNDPQECLPIIEDFSADEVVETIITRRMSDLLGVLTAKFPGAGPVEIAAIINDAKSKLVENLMQDKAVFSAIAQQRIRKRMDDVIGILSLSKGWDVGLLWSHYAEAYRGFVVGLDSDSEFFRKRADEESDIGFLSDVAYMDDLPRVRVEKLKLQKELLYTKRAFWAYECEQRLVRRLNHGISTAFKDNLGMPVVLFEVPIEAVREITIGFRAPDEVLVGASKLRASSGGGHIQLYKASISATSGALERAPV